jgi:hypothetical protein
LRLRASFSISVTVTLYFAITSLIKAVTWAAGLDDARAQTALHALNRVYEVLGLQLELQLPFGCHGPILPNVTSLRNELKA